MTDNVLTFPITQIESFDFLTEKETFYQLRLEAVKLLNRVSAGQCMLTEKNVEGLKFINSVSKEYGFEPLDFDPRFCVNVRKMGYLSED